MSHDEIKRAIWNAFVCGCGVGAFIGALAVWRGWI